LVAKAVVPKDNNYYEMPFEVQADGPYFNVLDFFGRLSRLSRIINVGDLEFADPEKAKGGHYVMRPGSTVSGTFMATTYFTNPGDSTPASSAAKPGAKH
jgi:Tfp pilus assembly protein PilO